ncbi:MAG: hypothetical protein A2Z07_05985 [Armatimonadetes bacterium RBG_16_67_12]|nr:MAG: hypothetical protein A2Z07_05985 [Armatimonadetes bacterium RBG_16_67_12]
MESHGVAGAIQVTEAGYARLKDTYEFEDRGIIQVKGKGEMRTCLLKGRNGEGVHPDSDGQESGVGTGNRVV